MAEFWMYDVGFMILFTIFVTWFLITRKKNLSREGIIFMYRTQLGIKFIKYIGDNFKRTLNSLRYVIIAVGLFLMSIMIWMLGQTLFIYIKNPEITEVIKAPPIAPLIPYFPKLFGMESFFPPFYFTYFIVALAIVAIVHEFSHGIFMRRFGIKIKSTGLVFLGPILGAFVEEEKRGFEKKKNVEQMTVLGAGVFANSLFALIFYGLYVLFFLTSFTPSGYMFNSYTLVAIPLGSITGFEDLGNLTKVNTNNGSFYLDDNLAGQLELGGRDYLIAYAKAPAVLVQMRGAIIEANGVKIKNHDDLRLFLESVNPGDSVYFLTETHEGINEYTVILSEHPSNSSKPYLGISHSSPQPRGIIQNLFVGFMKFKDSSTLYKPAFDGELAYFILHLLWWIMVINLLVALFNMLPLGILDGGRFFYLAVLSVTGSENFAKSAFKIMTYAILLIFLFLMFIWFVRIF